MRKRHFFILILFAVSCTKTSPKLPVSIIGTIFEPRADSIQIEYPNRRILKVAVSKMGTFKFSIIPDSPSYYLLNGRPVFVTPGTVLKVLIKDSVMTFTGTGSTENLLMQKVDDIMATGMPFGKGDFQVNINEINPQDFINKLRINKDKASEYIKNNNPENGEYLIKTQLNAIACKEAYYANLFRLKYGIDKYYEKQFLEASRKSSLDGKRNTSQIMDLFNMMHVKRLSSQENADLNNIIWANFNVNDKDLFRISPEYRFLLRLKLDLWAAESRRNLPNSPGLNVNEIKLKVIRDRITEPYMQQSLLFSTVKLLLKPNQDIDDTFKKYSTLVTDPILQTEILASYKRLKKFSPGYIAPTFAFKDVNNKTIYLSDFLGHYVYIDIWATWCQPCIAEQPSLARLEKAFLNSNIKFLGISVDAPSNLNKWKMFVKNEQINGTQIISNKSFDSDFIKDFNIVSIPRYLLIGKDGKIISADALRPSDEHLMSLLSSYK